MLSLSSWCVSTARTFMCDSREIELTDSTFHSTKNARIRVFPFFFFLLFSHRTGQPFRLKEEMFPSPSRVLACKQRGMLRSPLKDRASQTCKDGVHLRAACRIFFHPLQTYVRYVSKSPPATSPSLIQHGTHDCTIKPPIVRPLAASRKKLHR